MRVRDLGEGDDRVDVVVCHKKLVMCGSCPCFISYSISICLFTSQTFADVGKVVDVIALGGSQTSLFYAYQSVQSTTTTICQKRSELL